MVAVVLNILSTTFYSRTIKNLANMTVIDGVEYVAQGRGGASRLAPFLNPPLLLAFAPSLRIVPTIYCKTNETDSRSFPNCNNSSAFICICEHYRSMAVFCARK